MTPGRFETLGPTLKANQLDGVFVRQFPRFRTLKDRVHQASDVALGLRGKIQAL
jgi:hypothetical protein